MRVFSGVSPNEGDITVKEAVVAILERAQEQKSLSSKWSLAELQLDNDDFDWLCNWANSLSGITVQLWLEVEPWRSFHIGNRDCTRSIALGTLLLLFTAETARRKATEGILWAAFQQDCFSVSTLRTLFMSGQPIRSYKDALEGAARWLNLRHVFGIEGLQNWFDTVYLQFGFTYRGFVRRLPEWLVGQGRTQAIQHLQNGPMRSDTFCTLWDALRNFRRNNIKEEQLKSVLARNPWILPEWIDELAAQATARIELGYGGEASPSETNGAFEPFLDEPTLRWNPPEIPQFVCQISNIARFDLSEPTYYIMIAGHVCTQLRRDANGVYTFHPSEEIVLPTMVPLLVATLVSSTGQIVSSVTLQLWNNNDDITVFRASSGRRIDAWHGMMRSDTAYLIITASDVILSPEPLHWYILDTQGTKLSLINQGWSSSTCVQLEGQVLWQPNINEVSEREEPRWARSVDISLHNISDEVSFGDLIQVKVRHPRGTKISFIRLGAKPIGFTEEDAQHTITEPILVGPDMLFHGSHLAELCFTLGIRNDTIFIRVSRALSIEMVGAAMVSAHGWTVLQPGMTITVEQAKTLPIQIFRPNIKKYALLEGDTWIGRPHHTPHPIGSLTGLGAPIKLREGPYNALEKDVSLVREVIDSGIITDVSRDDSYVPSRFVVSLARPIEVDAKHSVIIWNEDGQFYTCSQENVLVEVKDTSWTLYLPYSVTQPLVIAIAYDGVRLGTWWHAEWYNVLQQDNVQDSKRVAAMLRWFQLPLLSDRWFSQVQRFSCSHGSSVLPPWLSDDLPPIDLRWVAIDDHWLSAVRTVFKNWRPGDMATRKVVRQLGGTSETSEELLLRTAWRLLRVDPLLMGKVVLSYVVNVCLPQFGVGSTRTFIRTISSAFAHSVHDSDADLQRKKALLLEEVSDTMGYIDTNFIRRGLIEPALQVFQGRNLTMLNENNITLALSIEPFRRLLGIQILEIIGQVIAFRR